MDITTLNKMKYKIIKTSMWTDHLVPKYSAVKKGCNKLHTHPYDCLLSVFNVGIFTDCGYYCTGE